MSCGVADDLRAVFEGGTIAGLTDGQLLERFASGGAGAAEAAFAGLVARHGPMVLATCRVALRNAHDAEDAFQATFLTLARKAGSLRRPERLGPWLHGVACRTSRRLKDKEARRRRHEATAPTVRAPLPDRADIEAIEALHEEIARLPERYRTAIVLCDLQGLTHHEAGHRLGRPAGTIGARVSRARERLRGRLIRRGFAVPAVAIGAVGGTARATILPSALSDAATRIAMELSRGGRAASLPTGVVSLARGAARSVATARLAVISAAVLALGAATAGMAVLAQQGGPRPAGPVAEAARPSPPRSGDGSPATDALGDPLPAGARLRLGTLRFRPPSVVAEMALSPDEATIVTVGEELIAWDAVTGKERWRAQGRDHGFMPPAAAYGSRPLAFAFDGTRVFTTGRPGEVVAWETSTGRREVIMALPPDRIPQHRGGATRSIDIAPDGRKLAFGNAIGIVVCDLRGEALYTILNFSSASPPAIDNNDRLGFDGGYSLGRFSPDGTRLAAVTSDRPQEIGIHDAATGRELRTIALSARLVRMAFSPDGRRLATTERDGAVRLYDLETGRRVWSRVLPLNNPYENYTSAVAFSPDSRTIAAGATDNRIHLLRASDGAEGGQLVGHHWYPWTLAFTADSKRLYSSGWDPAIRRWDVDARKELPLPVGVRAACEVAASPDGRTLAYQDDSGATRLVDAGDGTERRRLALPGTWYTQLAFSADGRRLAGGGTAGDRVHVAVWDLPDGRLLHRWDWPKGRDPHSDVESLAFAPDGKRLAAAVFRQSTAYLWDPADGRQIARLRHDQVYGLSFRPDGRTLATVGWDSIIRLWEADTGECRHEFRVREQAEADARIAGGGRAGPVPAGGGPDLRMFAVCYAPGGDILATAHLDGQVWIWQADDLAMRSVFPVPNWFRFGAMSFSPDGLWLATGVAGGRVDLWDPTTGANVWDRGRHQADVYTVGFGRDSRTLVSGGKDGACYLWDLRPPGPLPPADPGRLWDDLAGDDGPAAYRAMWALSEAPDRAVALLAEKLRPVTTVIDLDRVDFHLSPEENHRRRRMRAIPTRKDPKVASTVAARRAVALLARIGTPGAVALLDELAGRDPKGDLGRLAAAARDRSSRAIGP